MNASKFKEVSELKSDVWAYMDQAGVCFEAWEKLLGLGYLAAPASSKYHLAVEGGLARHSINVVNQLTSMRVFYTVASACRVGMLHDLVKMFNYVKTADGYKRVTAPYPGHGAASVQIAQELGIELNPEEVAAITWHMGEAGLEGDRLAEYRAAVKRFPRAVLLTHAADYVATIEEEGGAK